MSFSLTEFVAEHYYRRQGYIVQKNVPILPAEDKWQHWSDLDLLATDGEKLLLINCKDFLPSSKQKDKIVENFLTADEYLKGVYPKLHSLPKKFVYIYIDSDRKTLEFLKRKKIKGKKIEIKKLEEILKEYSEKIDQKLAPLQKNYEKSRKYNTRYYRIGSLEGLDKFIAYLLNNSFLNEKKLGLEGKLSEPREEKTNHLYRGND